MDEACSENYLNLTTLINTLDADGSLQSCFLTTYALNLEWLLNECPCFRRTENRVPLCIVYGDKRQIERFPERSPFLMWAYNCEPLDQEESYTARRVWSARDVPDTVQLIKCQPLNESHVASHGVMHAKIGLLFTKSKRGKVTGLQIAISSANLVPPVSIDMTWTQWFPAASISGDFQLPPEDFGLYLEDFIMKLHQASSKNGSKNTIEKWFIKNKMSLSSLHRIFDFTSAAGAFVSSVPGTHIYKHKNVEKTSLQYGQRRIGEILSRISSSFPRKLSDEDQFLVQPTSIGKGMDDFTMHLFCRSFGAKGCDIMWPTEKYMALCAEKSLQGESGPLFMSPRNFRDLGPDLQQRFIEYKDSHPKWDHLVPHVKTYMRFYENPPQTKAAERSELSQKSSGSRLAAWLYLTSACLSRGAMGYWKLMDEESSLTMRNFEAGIMLWSTSDRYLVATTVQREAVDFYHGVRIYRTTVPFNINIRKYYCGAKPFFHDSTEHVCFSFDSPSMSSDIDTEESPKKKQRIPQEEDEEKEEKISREALKAYILERYSREKHRFIM
jgi:hypothetical protein